jgi:hypothetical protein
MASMATKLAAALTKSEPAEVVIPCVADDPTFAAAAELLSAFRTRLERLNRERMRLILERELDGKPVDPKSETDATLRRRLAALRADPPLLPHALPAMPGATPPAIALGLEVLAGNAITPPPDHAARMREIDRQIDALGPAINEQGAVCDALADELTLRYARQLKPAWDALQLEMYRAAKELSRATRRVQDFRVAITGAGIRSRTDILAMPNVRAPLVLGDETNFDSEISGWRRILERLGIL